jgi:DNA-binding response OmpR family regulator
MKKILMIEGDRLVASFYSEMFQANGFSISSAQESASAQELLLQKKPDLILLDPIFPQESWMALMGPLKEQAAKVPVFVFGDLPSEVRKQTASLGISDVQPSDENPARPVLDQVCLALGEELREATDVAAMRSRWRITAQKEAPELINALRRTLRDISRDQENRSLLHGFFREAHALSARASLIGFHALHRLTKALVALSFRLYKNVELVNPSTLRSLGEAIDFLAVLHQGDNAAKVHDSDHVSIFAIDDDIETHRVIDSAMEIVGLNIEAAADSVDSLRVLENKRCDLLLLDVGLPGMDGFTLCEKLRKIPLHEKTPVIFLTGMATFENRVQSNLSGGNAFIGKPFNLAELALKALVWVYKGQLGLAMPEKR